MTFLIFYIILHVYYIILYLYQHNLISFCIIYVQLLYVTFSIFTIFTTFYYFITFFIWCIAYYFIMLIFIILSDLLHIIQINYCCWKMETYKMADFSNYKIPRLPKKATGPSTSMEHRSPLDATKSSKTRRNGTQLSTCPKYTHIKYTIIHYLLTVYQPNIQYKNY